jgi:hypothetical protein
MNAVTNIKVATLPGLVDRAAQALANARDHAEVLEARDRASFAYDAAKKAGRLARAKHAHDELIAAAYRAQADALEIESQAKRRLADEYDAAQDRGEVQRHGKVEVSEGNLKPATLEDLGLTKKQVHEARQIRDAEESDPGIVRRVLDDKLARGEEPTKAAVRQEIAEKLGRLSETKKRAEEKLATLPTPAEALERSKETKTYVRANDGEQYLYFAPEQTQQYDVWLKMKPHVMALADPEYSAEAFAASADEFWLPRIPAHIDAAVEYLLEVKRQLEARNG